ADPLGPVRRAGLLGTEAVQVIHANKGAGRTLALLARILGPRPPLVVNRGVSFRLSLGGRFVDRSPMIAAVVAVCEAIRTDLVAQGMPRDKIEVVYSATDTPRFGPARPRRGRIPAQLRPPPPPP